MSEPMQEEIFPTDSKIQLVQADKGKRFLNYVIDAAAISVLQTILGNVFNFLDAASFTPFFHGYKIVFGIGLISTPLYYILAEHLFEGKTLGKLVTHTRTVSLSGARPTFNQILGRSFARIIPFEPFSYLGDQPNGWHDRLSETIVIDEQKSSLSSTDDEIV